MDSDQEIEFIQEEEVKQKDSGMSSLTPSPPERKIEPTMTVAETTDNNSEDFDDEPDETLAERLWGLTEMFPESARNFASSATSFSASSVKNVFQFSCNVSWIFFTSSMILFAPVIFETERAQMEEMQRSQQKQVLLGPGSAMQGQGGGPGGLPAMPPMAR